MQELKSTPITFSFEGMDRLFRAHGHTLHDVAQLRSGTFPRIPDIVVWPGTHFLINLYSSKIYKLFYFIFKIECHNHVVQLISSASTHNVAVVPVGGGINVTGALECSTEEKRMIVSLDTSQMVNF